jgi:Domain of unknown function (DUF4407)
MHWQPDSNLSPDADAPSRWDKWMRPLYWLAGARWETVRHCPATERERIAVLGSTVLIPTIMAFLGMFFYAKSRFHEPPWMSVTAISLAWGFIIMNTDRILLATYRPFQSRIRKFMQVCFRFALAGVVSVAISFPFCLDQYRPAIRNRYQAEVQVVLNQLRTDEAAGRRTLRESLQKIRDDGEAERARLVKEFDAQHEALTSRLPDLQKAILNPETYADERMEEERRRAGEPDFVAPASGATRNVLAQIDAQKETLAKTKAELTERQDLHRRLVEAIAREALGQPNEFYPEPKKPGDGPRLKDMQARDRGVVADIRRLESSESAQQAALLASDKQLAAARLADKNAYLDGLVAKRAAFIAEGEEKERIRKANLAKVTAQIEQLETGHAGRLDKLKEHLAAQEVDHAIAQKRHDETYLPPIARREAQIAGVLDPMEETIGLYKVIFLPAPDAADTEKGEQGYKWIAGLFQFLVIFGTLFVLDLVPIMAKIFSRPGPYDVLVEHPEFIACQNLAAYQRAYRGQDKTWDDSLERTEPDAKRLLTSRRLPPGDSGGKG